MGLVINIGCYGEWSSTYFVQTTDELEAKEKAFKAFRQTASCYLPDTIEEAENCNGFYIEVADTVDAILV